METNKQDISVHNFEELLIKKKQADEKYKQDYYDIKTNDEQVMIERQKKEGEYFNQLKTIYEQICEEAYKTSDEAIEEINHFDIFERLNQSPYILDNKRMIKRDIILRDISLCMYEISDIWGKIAKIRHEKEQERKNLFFISYYKDKTSVVEENYTAKLFNLFTPPYNRLVSLSINEKNNRIDLRPILHEMGHYIGFRNREKRKTPLQDLICYSIFGKIYQICNNLYDSISYNEKPRLVFDQSAPIGKQRRLYCEGLFTCCYYIYLELNEYIKKEVQIRIKCEDEKDKYVRECFAKEYAKILLPIIDGFLANTEKISQILNVYNYSEDVIINIHKAIILLLKEHSYNNYSEVAMTLNSIEEPTADCFMIATFGMELKDYLKLILDNSYDFWEKNQDEEKTPENFCKFMSAPDHRIRLIAICTAMLGTDKNKTIESLYSKHLKNQFFWKKAACIKAACKMLTEMNKNSEKTDEEYAQLDIFESDKDKKIEIIKFAQNILNPQKIISEYISGVLTEYAMQLGIKCGNCKQISVNKKLEEEKNRLDKQLENVRGLQNQLEIKQYLYSK